MGNHQGRAIRTGLLALAAALLLMPAPAAWAQGGGGHGNAPILVDQGGRRIPVWPLHGTQNVVDFYQYGIPNGASANFNDPPMAHGLSQIFFYHDDTSNQLSLIVVHDQANDGTGGAVEFDFWNLPSAASVAQGDDPPEATNGHIDANGNGTFVWRWFPCCTDGVAIELPDSFEFSITPRFNTIPGLIPGGEIIDTWIIRSWRPNQAAPDDYILEMDEDLMIVTPGHPSGRKK